MATSRPAPAGNAEARIAVFLDRYDPAIAAQLRAARERLRAWFPRGYELVFDNYNALVFGMSPTEKRTDAFVSVVGYPRWVTLFFLDGTRLHDPAGLLQGSGKQVRSIRLADAAQLDAPDVRELLRQAIETRAAELQAAPPLSTMIKLAMAAPRNRRPSAGTAAPGGGRKSR
ncbi:DUF1801 domain-containing protein [Dyella sp. C9]|uniref:DUF1801 domain-containing protein n=1 Tax=Dyella sp. C9 TaxID=2202154 RepID=UPI000DEFA830|nr:DUF1801 domain-containing protein [Dyella sp. C9]